MLGWWFQALVSSIASPHHDFIEIIFKVTCGVGETFAKVCAFLYSALLFSVKVYTQRLHEKVAWVLQPYFLQGVSLWANHHHLKLYNTHPPCFTGFPSRPCIHGWPAFRCIYFNLFHICPRYFLGPTAFQSLFFPRWGWASEQSPSVFAFDKREACSSVVQCRYFYIVSKTALLRNVTSPLFTLLLKYVICY